MSPEKLATLVKLVDHANCYVRDEGVVVELYQEETDHVKVRLFEPKLGDLDPAKENSLLAEVSWAKGFTQPVKSDPLIQIVFPLGSAFPVVCTMTGQNLAGLLLIRWEKP